MYGQWTRIWWKSTGTLRLDTTTAPTLQDGTRVEWNLKKERSLLLFHELSMHVKPRWRNWKDFVCKNFPIYGSVCSDACHKRAIWGMLEANDLSLAASSSFLLPFHSLVVACLKKPGETCSSMSACQMQSTWSIVWRLRNLSLFRPLHLSPLSVETVSMWRRRSASQVDPGQSTGRRHPTGLKSSLHFFSLHTDSFCVLKLHFTSWWLKKNTFPLFLFSLTVLLCIGHWLL